MTLAFFAEMAWKSAVISAAALLLVRLLRGRSAADRATLLRLSVVLLLALPLLAGVLPRLNLEEPDSRAFGAGGPVQAALVAPAAAVEAFIAPVVERFPIEALIFPAYFTGVLIMLGRLAIGLAALTRWTRAARSADPAWDHALRRLVVDGRAPVRLLVSDHAPSPLTWGLRVPVILLDEASHRRPRDADAILAHELAHVARGDWPMLVLSHVAVALFWFNPLVWRLEASLVHHTEEAADAEAVGRIEPVSYARALVDCAGGPAPLAQAAAMAGGAGLVRRLNAVLDPARRRVRSGSPWTIGAMAACVALTGAVAAVELAAPAHAEAVVAIAAAAGERSGGAAAAAQTTPTRRQARAAAEAGLDRSDEQLTQADAVTEDLNATAEWIFSSMIVDEAHAKGLQAVGYRNFTREELNQLRVFDVTPADLRGYAQAGLLNLSAGEIVHLTIHKVTPEFIRGMAEAGYPRIDRGQLLNMRILGVTPEFARRANAEARRVLPPEQLVRAKVLGNRASVAPPTPAAPPAPAGVPAAVPAG